MSFLSWVGLVGALLLVMALLSAYVRRLPITTSAIYLGIGVLLSPAGLDLVSVDFEDRATWLEHLTEIGVIVSLFIGGLKLRLPLRNAAWSPAYRLAGPVMLACIAGVAAIAHYALGFEWPLAVLLGAVLAPTDPVLASTVTVNDSADRDRMRYGLSGEAGFNDGAAFPFVVFALLWAEQGSLGGWIGEWALLRLLWAVPAGLLFGYAIARLVGKAAIWLRVKHRDVDAPEDFLALALIALAYFGAETIGAWGFLAVFTAGLGFRHAEVSTVANNPLENDEKGNALDPEVPHPAAEHLVGERMEEEALDHPSRAAGVVVSQILSFGDTAERLLEVTLVVLLGICLASYWDWRAVPLALALFFLVRPITALLFLKGTGSNVQQRLMMGWFGIRGIGSVYYLSYALSHGPDGFAVEAIGLTLSVVALSVVVHGLSSQPLLDLYERRLGGTQTAKETAS